jgi:menaquinone-dependent protoporphyrinogen oxidase
VVVAGALPYTRYNIVKRWIMRRIVAKAHGDTDTTRDYEYTDWQAVGQFAHDFSQRVEVSARCQRRACSVSVTGSGCRRPMTPT